MSQFLSSPFEHAHIRDSLITECALHIEMWETCQRKLNVILLLFPAEKVCFIYILAAITLN